jgi:hypothetical protein
VLGILGWRDFKKDPGLRNVSPNSIGTSRHRE